MSRKGIVATVAEYVMGFERGRCRGEIGGANVSALRFESWFYCDSCGAKVEDYCNPICANYDFPAFDIIDLMRKLGDMGIPIMLRYDPLREHNRFTLTACGERITDCEGPFGALCAYGAGIVSEKADGE